MSVGGEVVVLVFVVLLPVLFVVFVVVGTEVELESVVVVLLLVPVVALE